MPRTIHLSVPVSEAEIRSLQLDDIVYITGDAYVMLYADHYTHIMDLIKAGQPLPMELKDGVIYNTGVIYRKEADGRYDLRALGATTSSKFNAYTPGFIELTGIRIVIGKGGMDLPTLGAMQKHGCVYLAIVGGCSAVYTPLSEITGEFWPEFTPVDNQRLKLRIREFGPLYVAMDANGNSIFEECANHAQDNLPRIYSSLGIDVG